MVCVTNYIFLYRFVFGKLGLEKVFSTILNRKLALFDQKNRLKKEQTKGLVHGFGQKVWSFVFDGF